MMKYSESTIEDFRNIIRVLSDPTVSEEEKFDLLWEVGDTFGKGI